MDVTLIIHSEQGTREVPVTVSRLTLGRTDDADVAIDDSSLSRVHASINRDGDRVWIVDEGSTNGTLVNRQPVPPTGTPLSDGDEIDLGSTTIVVAFNQPKAAASFVGQAPGAVVQTGGSHASGFPMLIVAAAIGVVVILFGAIALGLALKNRSNDNGPITVKRYSTNGDDGDGPSATPKALTSPADGATPTATPTAGSSPTVDISVPPTKTYQAMSQDERRQFVQTEAQHVARMIGNREGYAFTPEVVTKIKVWTDSYAVRLHSAKPSGGCNMHHDLATLLTRAHTHAPLVVKAFNEKGLSAQVGLYLAMIESEYCPCLSSGTGAKGMFQFVGTTARRYGVPFVTANSRDTAPDDRCKVEIMAPIAAQYMKDLIAMFGTGPLSVPLAVASYNEGEGGLSGNLIKALNATRTSDDPERSFWTMVAHDELMSSQFQKEAIKYVPHFFGAAIVGENPRVFGVDLEPISSYTQQQPSTADTASP
jgi:pSer/pThr/pTyr-binding forkhead associated (FHA) protein